MCMKKDYSQKPVNKKTFRFFAGVSVCLFCICLFIGVGYPIKGITFPVVFLFGWFSYLLYIYLYIQGLALIFAGKVLKHKNPFRLSGVLVFLLGLLILASIISYQSLGQTYPLSVEGFINQLNSSNFFNDNKLNMFSWGFGGGCIGYFFAGLFGSTNLFVGYLLASLIVVIGISLFIVPWILKASKKKVVEKENKPDEILLDHSAEYDPVALANSSNGEGKIVTQQVVNQGFSKPSVSFGQPQSVTPINSSGNGSFVRAKFHGDLAAESVSADSESSFYKEDSYVEDVAETLAPSTNGEETTTCEEPSNEDPYDENLLTQKPIFVEEADNPENSVVPKNEIPAVKKEPQSKPVEEKPKVKKPIKWVPPSNDLLDVAETREQAELNEKTALERQAALNDVFNSFGVRAEVINFTIGPSVTRYNVKYDPNVSVKRVEGLIEDISLRLGGVSARFEAVVQGSYFSGIEIPNAVITTVSFKDVFDALPDVKKHPLAVAFGKNIQGDVIWADFNEFPHILVAGTTGSGKSIFIHSLISTLIMRCSPETLRLGLIDPKKVEMVRYKEVPHLLRPILTDPKETAVFLNKLVEEMNDRYSKFEAADGCTSLDEYNEYAEENHIEKIPYIVVIVDEYGDLVESCKEVGQPILLLGQKARACGIHMLISTQSPTTTIITGTIKNNLATHVALATANTTQSITILGEGGAEKLLGKGDMLVQSPIVSRVGLARLQGCYINRKECNRVVGYLREHYETIYDDKYMHLEDEINNENSTVFAASDENGTTSDSEDESKYQAIKSWVMANNYMSMSRIQGECAVGFNRARRYFSRLQKEGIVSYETEGNKGCVVLIHDDFGSDDVVVSDEQSDYGN